MQSMTVTQYRNLRRIYLNICRSYRAKRKTQKALTEIRTAQSKLAALRVSARSMNRNVSSSAVSRESRLAAYQARTASPLSDMRDATIRARKRHPHIATRTGGPGCFDIVHMIPVGRRNFDVKVVASKLPMLDCIMEMERIADGCGII